MRNTAINYIWVTGLLQNVICKYAFLYVNIDCASKNLNIYEKWIKLVVSVVFFCYNIMLQCCF